MDVLEYGRHLKLGGSAKNKRIDTLWHRSLICEMKKTVRRKILSIFLVKENENRKLKLFTVTYFTWIYDVQLIISKNKFSHNVKRSRMLMFKCRFFFLIFYVASNTF